MGSWDRYRHRREFTLSTEGSDDDLLFIYEPDWLVSPTTITDTLSCMRRGVIKARVGSSMFTNKAAVIGTFRHDLFEKALLEKDFSPSFLQNIAKEIAWSSPRDLIAGNLTEEEVLQELIDCIPQISSFATGYTNFNDGKGGDAEGSKLVSNCADYEDLHFRAIEVHDTEEDLILPELGLTGKVDVTFQVSRLFFLLDKGSLCPQLIGGFWYFVFIKY